MCGRLSCTADVYCLPACLQYTLHHTFGYAYGKSTAMAWRAVGGGLMTVLPALTYTLKVSTAVAAAVAAGCCRMHHAAPPLRCRLCLVGRAAMPATALRT